MSVDFDDIRCIICDAQGCNHTIGNGEKVYCEDCYEELKNRVTELEEENEGQKERISELEEKIDNLNATISEL